MSGHQHTKPPSDVELWLKALESILTAKQRIDPEAVDPLINTYDN